MFWDSIAGVYDVFVNVINKKHTFVCVRKWKNSSHQTTKFWNVPVEQVC